MRRFLATLLLATAAFAAPAFAAERHAYAPGIPLERHTLANGLTVLIVPLPNSPVTTTHVWVKAGSRDEKPGTTGIAHLFEHMMFRPTKEGAPSYYDKAAQLGLEYNASTRFNATDYHATFVPAGDTLDAVLAMEADRFKNMNVTPELLDLEREAVRSEYSTKFDASPVIDLWFWIYRLAYPGHPYGWHIVGDRADLERITAEDANRFFEANYTPGNTLVAIAGPVEPAAALSRVTAHFDDWTEAPAKPAWKRPAPVAKHPVVGRGKLGAPSKYMLIGYRTPERTERDRLAQDLAGFILFEGRDGLVPKRLVDESHVASMADAFNTDYDLGLNKLLVLPASGVSPERVHAEIQSAISGFHHLPEADFEAYRRAYAVRLREAQLKTVEVTGALGRAWAYDGDFRHAFTDPDAVLKLPRAEVSAVINRTYRVQNRVTALTP